ncbi:MAG: hypothetical protein JW384_01615 [Nitrosomonadaceae bacterium]|nr:hypothetical protein [Nitrosomonadaceae bacterium]
MPRKKLPPGVVHARRLACARKWRKKNKEWVSLYNARYWETEAEKVKAQRKKRAKA